MANCLPTITQPRLKLKLLSSTHLHISYYFPAPRSTLAGHGLGGFPRGTFHCVRPAQNLHPPLTAVLRWDTPAPGLHPGPVSSLVVPVVPSCVSPRRCHRSQLSSLQGTFIQPYLSPPRAGAVSGLFFWDVHRTGGPRLSASDCYRVTEEEYSMPPHHERIQP